MMYKSSYLLPMRKEFKLKKVLELLLLLIICIPNTLLGAAPRELGAAPREVFDDIDTRNIVVHLRPGEIGSNPLSGSEDAFNIQMLPIVKKHSTTALESRWLEEARQTIKDVAFRIALGESRFPIDISPVFSSRDSISTIVFPRTLSDTKNQLYFTMAFLLA